MKSDKEKWMEDVFESMKGSQRARPQPELLEKIMKNIDAPEAKVVPMYQWRIVAAAAVLLLVLNIFALNHYTQNSVSSSGELAVEDASSQLIISNYKIYE